MFFFSFILTFPHSNCMYLFQFPAHRCFLQSPIFPPEIIINPITKSVSAYISNNNADCYTYLRDITHLFLIHSWFSIDPYCQK